nr:hypothetical protein [uncultured Methylophaga sp.]
MNNLILTIMVMSFIVVSAGCASNRKITEFDTPTGKLKCAEPPPDVITTGAQANVEALIPEIKVDVKADASATTTVERIRAEIPNLQAVEALEYRMCLAYGNGIIDSETYQEFFNNILPMLQGVKTSRPEEASTSVEPPPPVERTLNIEERRSYSGVTGCNTERSRRTAESACDEGGRNYASRNNLVLVSSRMVTFTQDIDHDREPWPSNARSCDAQVVANCQIVVKER